MLDEGKKRGVKLRSCLMEECEREIQEERAKCKEYFEKVLKERLMNEEEFTDILRGL